MHRNSERLIGYGFLALCCIAWELLAARAANRNFPAFSEVIAVLMNDRILLFQELLITLTRAAAGFLLALAIMLPLGLVLGRVRVLGDLLEPVIDLLRPLPPIAIVPVAMLFAGPGSATKIAVVCYGASIPIVIHAIDAVRNLHPMLNRVSRSLGLRPIESMVRVDLPAALPQLMTGIRLGIVVSLLIAVSAEMLLSTDGLGALLVRSQESFLIARGLAGLVVIAGCSLIVNNLVAAVEGRLLHWHYARLQPGVRG